MSTENEILEMLSKLSDEEKATLLETEFPEEIEKQAEAIMAQSDLANSLYAFGALSADAMVEGEVEEGEELDKEASEQLEQVETEISANLEAALVATGIANTEDAVELHKEAQAAAAIMFEGFSDQFEELTKEAAAKSLGKKAKKLLGAAGKMLKKHKGKAIAGGALAAGLGAYGLKKHMDKKASETTADEMSDLVIEKIAVSQVIESGVEKLAAKGGAKGSAFKKGFEQLKGLAGKAKSQAEAAAKAGKKAVSKHPAKAGFAGGALAGAAGLKGYQAMKEKKD